MPPDLAILSNLIGSNYLCLELIFMVPKVFESLKFDSIYTMLQGDILDDTFILTLQIKISRYTAYIV